MHRASVSSILSAAVGLLVAGSILAHDAALADQPSAKAYPWLSSFSDPLPETVSIEERFPAPAGYRRTVAVPGSYAHWLRNLPARTDRSTVHAYDGTRLKRPSAAVVLMDVGNRDLMQCADAIIRLHAEFMWAQGNADKAAYRFTSGDESRWKDWREGEQFLVRGSTVTRASGKPRANSHSSYRKWLDLIFTYAGTSSLARDTQALDSSVETVAGDFFVDPGFPGHAVLVLDVAEDNTGQRVALLGQGFMPAEDFHVLQSEQAVGQHWFLLPKNEGSVLDTPSWPPFSRSDRRRFPKKN